ncbi:MAG: hypothetical protein E6G82_08355 [Alphaproteobacteria bacterium]|jgi:hypothetical protein|nr:MAG: hypothetical protein E6G82_08355 [Alphaproteobacteria bacterium]
MTELMEKGSSFVRDLGDAARENPISAALIGMGILWMFGGSAASVARRARVDRMLDRAGEASEATGSMIRTTGARLGENVTSATRKVQSSASAAIEEATRFGREQIEGANRFGRDQMEEARRFGAEQTDTLGRYAKSLPEYARSIPDYARAIPESGGEMMHTLRSNLAELFKAQPLALGAIGLAIGAGIAAALPPTKAESEYLGETSEAVQEKAKRFAGEAKEVAEDAFNAAAEEARRQRLTLEGAKSAADEVSQRASRVAGAATGKGESEPVTPNFQ